MVGIWGVGGGGKTTLASAAYTEISHQFEAHCLLEKIRDESSKHGLKKLQELFLSSVLKTNVVVESEIEGRSMIERRLCRKRVLVLLDDVDDLEQLKKPNVPGPDPGVTKETEPDPTRNHQTRFRPKPKKLAKPVKNPNVPRTGSYPTRFLTLLTKPRPGSYQVLGSKKNRVVHLYLEVVTGNMV
ncbi:putative P-loop containing nucleoside triphosphate hydrolase [Helianthus annuus]|nr:putative P-loop containing nucleoside triphosphate hydrolase [Helianthus annuus]